MLLGQAEDLGVELAHLRAEGADGVHVRAWLDPASVEDGGGGIGRRYDDLRPGGAAEALIALLSQHPSRKRILVVGHEPDLSELAGRLIGAGHRAHLALKKAGCCLVEFTEFPPKSPGKLIWWLTPRVMRRLA